MAGMKWTLAEKGRKVVILRYLEDNIALKCLSGRKRAIVEEIVCNLGRWRSVSASDNTCTSFYMQVKHAVVVCGRAAVAQAEACHDKNISRLRLCGCITRGGSYCEKSTGYLRSCERVSESMLCISGYMPFLRYWVSSRIVSSCP